MADKDAVREWIIVLVVECACFLVALFSGLLVYCAIFGVSILMTVQAIRRIS